MRKSSTGRAAALLAFAGMIAACGGSGDTNDRRSAQAERSPSPQQNAQAAALVSLSGCLEAAPGSNRYLLRNVRFEPRAGDPHATTTTSGAHGITEGAWVRVDGGDRDLTGYLGQRVMLNGTVTDSGRNTIGTGGASGVQTPSGDTSQAASQGHHADKQKKEMGRNARESMADGTAAQVRVQQVTATGDRCAPTQPR